SDLQLVQVVDLQVREAVQTGIREISRRGNRCVAVEADAQFVRQRRRERVVLVDRDEVELVRQRLEEGWQRRCVIDPDRAVIDVAATNLIRRRDVIVHARRYEAIVGEGWRQTRQARRGNLRAAGPVDRGAG